MSEQKTAEYYVDALARGVKDLTSNVRPSGLQGRVIVDEARLDKLKRLSEVYLDEGCVELWIIGCPRGHDPDSVDRIKLIKTVRAFLSLGLCAAKSMVDDLGLPFKIGSFTSLVDVERCEAELPGLTFERRKPVRLG